ncbi:hypothetical protein [uncultured Cloacibacillus sp.]|uniref:Y-family DNA polymerase n=1 Tax=uncultured Cloacibacillus sp. TaxID=889794 RepID=UPI00320AD1BD
MRSELHDRRIGLSDANNFFVSCERCVNPALNGRPVVVLSGNDGCVIARSNEVKLLGVPMGAPYFQYRSMLAYNGVAIRSANHKLYNEISSQVMSVIKRYSDAQEIYSIDECFINLAISSVTDVVKYCRTIRKAVWDKCRIPVSIGIAPSKTLAKLASEYAKKHPETLGVYWMDATKYRDAEYMSQIDVSDVWGIGPRMANALRLGGIKTAAQFMLLDDRKLQRRFGVNGVFCAWELRGYPAYPIATEGRVQKSIMVSRTFGESITDYADLQDALLCFTVSAARQLRAAKQMAKRVAVKVETSRFNADYYANAKEFDCNTPVSSDADLIKIAVYLLEKIFIPGKKYKRCGILLSEFQDVSQGVQTSLFGEADNAKQRRAMAAIDAINSTYDKAVIKPAIIHTPEGEHKKWQGKSEFKSETASIQSRPTGNLRFQSHSEDFA